MSYEDVLPSTTPKYEFKGIQDCLQILERPGEQHEAGMDSYIIFNIDERSFLDYIQNSDESLLRKSWKFYDPSLNLLVVKAMESTTHGAAQGAFEKIFEAWTGFDENYPLLATRNATFRGASGRNKRPDSAWQPLHAASGRSSHWPTIVLEVACSESRRKIERDIKFWLTESNDQVNIALTMRIYNRGRISVEEWRGRGPNRPPIPCQRIDIVRDAGLNGSRVQGSFRLSYEDIHLRERPQKATDFTLTAGNMEYIAKAVWEFQFA